MVHRGITGSGFVGFGRMLVLLVVVLAAAAALRVLLVAVRDHAIPVRRATDSALAARVSVATRTLDERHARGGIDEEGHRRSRPLLTSP
jgi:uncharacterized membrane protein